MIDLKIIKRGEIVPAGLSVCINQKDVFNGETIDFINGDELTNAEYDYMLRIGNFELNNFITANPKRHIVGSKENNDLRHVYQYIGPETNLPFRLGLTVHQSKGSWSSTPHQFEKENILNPKPIDFHEYFLYLTNPTWQWGLQVRTGHLPANKSSYASSGNSIINQVEVIRHLDLKQIPLGSHPVSFAPGVRGAYIWCYWSDELSIMEKFKDGEHQ